jgi:AcrR family transcriptional regulator
MEGDMQIIHTKERIVFIAIEIIDELGIQGLSTREIAKRLDISEGTIFKHYNSKNEIFLSVLEHYSKFDLDIIKTTELKELKPKDAILFFINAFAEYYENYPAITAISQVSDVLSNIPELQNKIESIYKVRTEFLVERIEEAKNNHSITEDVVSEYLADIISGIMMYTNLKWRLNHFDFSLKSTMNSSVEMVLNKFFQK